MVQYPIHVALKSYKGSKPNLIRKNTEDNRIAAELEKVVNKMIEDRKEDVMEVMYYQIAAKTVYSIDKIRELLGYMGGYHGLTVNKLPPLQQ